MIRWLNSGELFREALFRRIWRLYEEIGEIMEMDLGLIIVSFIVAGALVITVAMVWISKNINEFRTLPQRRSRRLWIYEIESL